MEYIQKPVNTQMPASSRDDISTCVSCAAHICWSYSGGGPCGLRVCITKFCGWNYS